MKYEYEVKSNNQYAYRHIYSGIVSSSVIEAKNHIKKTFPKGSCRMTIIKNNNPLIIIYSPRKYVFAFREEAYATLFKLTIESILESTVLSTSIDVSLIYCPYIPLTFSGAIIDPNTFDPLLTNTLEEKSKKMIYELLKNRVYRHSFSFPQYDITKISEYKKMLRAAFPKHEYIIVNSKNSSKNCIEFRFKDEGYAALFRLNYADAYPKNNFSVFLPIIRNIMPTIIANEIIGVQPMSGPVASIFSLKPTYSGSDASSPPSPDKKRSYMEEILNNTIEELKKMK